MQQGNFTIWKKGLSHRSEQFYNLTDTCVMQNDTHKLLIHNVMSKCLL